MYEAPEGIDPVANRDFPRRSGRRPMLLWGGLLLIGFAIIAMIWMMRRSGYEVALRIPDAHGVLVGSDVVYRGVKVGRVTSIDVEEGGVNVTLVITEPDVHVTSSDGIRILAPLAGVSRIEVVPGGNSRLDVDPTMAVESPLPVDTK